MATLLSLSEQRFDVAACLRSWPHDEAFYFVAPELKSPLRADPYDVRMWLDTVVHIILRFLHIMARR